MKVAVVVPCLNEELTVAKVVQDCRRYLPDARVYVLDNGSKDLTAERARQAGAHVIHSPLRGKGSVLKHAFRVIDADFYVMIDGDGTYPVAEARRLIDLAATHNYEMVTGARLQDARPEAFRPLHYLGNRLFTGTVKAIFGFPVQDLLTGFRVFSRRFCREVHILSTGFEVETEMTIRSIAQGLAFCEVPIPYSERPAGSRSKLRTFRDGWRILGTIVHFVKDFRPHLYYQPLAVLSYLLACMAPHVMQVSLSAFAAVLSAMGFYFESQIRFHRLRIGRLDEEPRKDDESQEFETRRRSA